MRYFMLLAAALGLFVIPLAASADGTSGMAPADEYFGRYGESVLEIRNRIETAYAQADAGIVVPGEIEGLDNLADAVLAWQHKYPGDPWVATAMQHLLRCFAKAGFATSPRATALLGSMLAAYPDAAQTKAALVDVGQALVPAKDAAADAAAPAAVGVSATGTATAPGVATVKGEVVDAASGTPVAGAVVVISPDRESTDVTAEPFGTTGSDGSFEVANVPLGGAFTAGAVSLAHAEYIVVEPPRGTAYAPYHGMLDALGENVAAGVIRLAAR